MVGKRGGKKESVGQEEINRILVEHAVADRIVVRLKGGDPLVGLLVSNAYCTHGGEAGASARCSLCFTTLQVYGTLHAVDPLLSTVDTTKESLV